MPDTLNLYYARIANMGDLLNPLIIERCFGYRVERCSFLTGDLCAIGSGLLGGQEFQVVDVALCQTVVALDGVLVRQRAAVQFQIELAAVFRHIVGGRFQLLHKVAHQHVFGAGHALQIFFAAGHLDHLKLGAAAAVTEAVGNQPLVGDGLFADAVIAVHNVVGQRLGVGPDVGLIQVGEHLCTVDALPQEGIIRKGRRIVPRHLRG